MNIPGRSSPTLYKVLSLPASPCHTDTLSARSPWLPLHPQARLPHKHVHFYTFTVTSASSTHEFTSISQIPGAQGGVQCSGVGDVELAFWCSFTFKDFGQFQS